VIQKVMSIPVEGMVLVGVAGPVLVGVLIGDV